MSVSKLRLSVAIESATLVVVLAAVATVVGGARVGLGVFAGGTLAIASFWRLAGDAVAATDLASSGRWLFVSVMRFGGLAAATAALFVMEWAHPAAFVVGVTILPFDLIVRGLRLASVSERD